MSATVKPNRVDKLQAEIRRIQAACTHGAYRITHVHPFFKDVDKTLIGSVDNGKPIRINLRCGHCSLEDSTTAAKSCPVCAGTMRAGDTTTKRMEEPWENSRLYKFRYYTCEACGCRVVLEE